MWLIEKTIERLFNFVTSLPQSIICQQLKPYILMSNRLDAPQAPEPRMEVFWKKYMLHWIKSGIVIYNKTLGKECLSSHIKFLKLDFVLTLLRKIEVDFIFQGTAILWKLVQSTAYKNCFKKLRPPMHFFKVFF